MIEIEVEDPAWTAALPDAEALAIVAAAAALQVVDPPPQGEVAEGRRGLKAASARGVNPLSRFATAPPEGEHLSLVILLTDDATVRDLNARFRGQDQPTNVLSFPAPANPEGHLGDIALAFGVCAGEAERQGKRLGRHLQHLVAHGVLHLLGYDHMNDDEAEEMEGLERVVLAGLGVADPYAAGERDHD